MVHDYLIHGLGSSPVSYAREYYAHYPKVAIGNWPPGFYLMQGLWTMAFPSSYVSVLVLMATIAAATAWMVFWLLQRSLPTSYSLLGAGAFLLQRPVGSYYSMVMAELPLTLAGTLAVCLLVRFLERERSRDLVMFVLGSLLVVLMKWNGLYLFLLVPFTVVISGQWRLLGIPLVWKSILTVLVLTLPWVLYFLPTMQSGWPQPDRWFTGLSNLLFYPPQIWRAAGPVAVLLAIVGAAHRLRSRQALSAPGGTVWLAAAAGFLSVVVFHSLVPSGLFDLRHVLPAFPFLAMFLAAGSHAVSVGLQRLVAREGHAALAGLAVIVPVAGLLAWQAASITTAPLQGFERAAFLAVAGDTSLASLISSDAPGEGAYVAHVAMQDAHRPSHTVWRGSKLFASATWAGGDYTLKAASGEGMLALLDSAGVSTVVIDGTSKPLPDQTLLADVVRANPARFTLVDSLPVRRGGIRYPVGIRTYHFHPATAGRGVALLRQTPGRPGTEAVPARLR
jgi:hypothetical protein